MAQGEVLGLSGPPLGYASAGGAVSSPLCLQSHTPLSTSRLAPLTASQVELSPLLSACSHTPLSPPVGWLRSLPHRWSCLLSSLPAVTRPSLHQSAGSAHCLTGGAVSSPLCLQSHTPLSISRLTPLTASQVELSPLLSACSHTPLSPPVGWLRSLPHRWRELSPLLSACSHTQLSPPVGWLRSLPHRWSCLLSSLPAVTHPSLHQSADSAHCLTGGAVSSPLCLQSHTPLSTSRLAPLTASQVEGAVSSPLCLQSHTTLSTSRLTPLTASQVEGAVSSPLCLQSHTPLSTSRLAPLTASQVEGAVSSPLCLQSHTPLSTSRLTPLTASQVKLSPLLSACSHTPLSPPVGWLRSLPHRWRELSPLLSACSHTQLSPPVGWLRSLPHRWSCLLSSLPAVTHPSLHQSAGSAHCLTGGAVSSPLCLQSHTPLSTSRLTPLTASQVEGAVSSPLCLQSHTPLSTSRLTPLTASQVEQSPLLSACSHTPLSPPVGWLRSLPHRWSCLLSSLPAVTHPSLHQSADSAHCLTGGAVSSPLCLQSHTPLSTSRLAPLTASQVELSPLLSACSHTPLSPPVGWLRSLPHRWSCLLSSLPAVTHPSLHQSAGSAHCLTGGAVSSPLCLQSHTPLSTSRLAPLTASQVEQSPLLSACSHTPLSPPVGWLRALPHRWSSLLSSLPAVTHPSLHQSAGSAHCLTGGGSCLLSSLPAVTHPSLHQSAGSAHCLTGGAVSSPLCLQSHTPLSTSRLAPLTASQVELSPLLSACSHTPLSPPVGWLRSLPHRWSCLLSSLPAVTHPSLHQSAGSAHCLTGGAVSSPLCLQSHTPLSTSRLAPLTASQVELSPLLSACSHTPLSPPVGWLRSLPHRWSCLLSSLPAVTHPSLHQSAGSAHCLTGGAVSSPLCLQSHTPLSTSRLAPLTASQVELSPLLSVCSHTPLSPPVG